MRPQRHPAFLLTALLLALPAGLVRAAEAGPAGADDTRAVMPGPPMAAAAAIPEEAPSTAPVDAAATADATRKVVLLNAGVAAFITAWGATNWEYGERAWHTEDEGWFGQDTDEGGADKAGHLYTGYVLARSLTGAFRHFGYDHHHAARVGALSSLAAMTFMEVGDGYSPYGYSWEDTAMNVAGAGLGWLLAENPSLDRKLALRGEYRFHADHTGDLLTDYERWRYYAALKLDGFEAMPEPLRWLEIHAGFFSRGYGDNLPGNERRETFVGVGLSLTKLARELGWGRTSVFLDYFQPDNTVLRKDRTLP